MTVREIVFGTPAEGNGYNPFSEPLAGWADLLFHGTSEERAGLIIQNGFGPTEDLTSSSFVRAYGIGVALKYACDKRHGTYRGAVLAVAFHDLNVRGIRQEGDVIYLDDHRIQPTLVAVCYVPHSYAHI